MLYPGTIMELHGNNIAGTSRVVNDKRNVENSSSALDKDDLLCYHIRAESVSVHANMAQVVEQLTRNEQVEGSSPSIGSYAARHDGIVGAGCLLITEV